MDIASPLKDRTADLLQLVLEQSHDVVQLVRRDGALEYMNPYGIARMGIGECDELADCRWEMVWAKTSRADALAALERAYLGQRARFDAQTATGEKGILHWRVAISPITGEDGEPGHFLVIAREQTIERATQLAERSARRAAERHADHSKDLAREMRHRFKNQLAVVGAVVKLLARHSETPAELASKFDEKLAAMAKAQDLLSITHDHPLVAQEAIDEVLAASSSGDMVNVELLPTVYLRDESIQDLALILGELQTNSLKYGTLSNDAGPIILSNELGDGVLTLHWTEDCGRKVEIPASNGAGTKLIERLGSVAGKRAHIEWRENGPRITFHLRTIVEPAGGGEASRL